MPARSSVTAGVWPEPAPQRLPVPSQKCSSAPLAWPVATFHGRAVASGPGPADSSAQHGRVRPRVLHHWLIGAAFQLTM
eukprot:13727324-Alexandrium_andersonii.AAC.1